MIAASMVVLVMGAALACANGANDVGKGIVTLGLRMVINLPAAA
jgi:hypothetical protein